MERGTLIRQNCLSILQVESCYSLSLFPPGGFKKLLKKIDSKLRKCKSQSRRCTPKTLDKIINRDRRLKDLPTQRVCGE